MKKSRLALLQSVISLLLCFSMLVGTTFAWFTDGVSSGTNMIAAGSLDIELDYLAADGTWQPVNKSTEVLDKNALWEPGYTEVAYLRITNAGTLALKYALGIGILAETGSVNVAGDAFKLSDYIEFGVVESESEITYANRTAARNALTDTKLIREGYSSTYPMKDKGDVRYVALVVYMPEEVGNAANYATGQNPPKIELGIELVATQEVHESDSFGTDYDTNAVMPGFTFPATVFGENTSADVEKDSENKVAEQVTIQGAATNAVIPAGVQLEAGAEKLTLEVTSMNESNANITLGENDAIRSLNVHMDGVSADNTKPMEITIKEAASKGLNAGNLKLYHVENGATVEMTMVDTFTAHNQFKYDPATGDITLYMATFSEVALVADTENAWNGTVATAFAGGEGSAGAPYLIANADQFVYFGDLISNDNENYGGKHYKLIADINLGGDDENEDGYIFYPIGYHAKGGTIAPLSDDDAPEAYYIIEEDTKTPGSAVAEGDANFWYTYGGSFKGTFDGAGHKISNIYQNTWQLKGNYDGNYWNAAMGLFGYVYGGTIKNLTVAHFSSDGEFTPTGVIAAYADGNSTFENIAITNCNPRVYNTGNGGIVGIGGNSSDPDTYKLTFTNITIDNTNKISALWGSWDVACGGLVGMFRGAGHVYMTNCHVAAQIDVYNDVCGNYQYYWYRYAGMMVGTNKNMTTDTNGYTVPETSKFHAENCTVHFGEWNDYYYCELVANSLASYTHDHQFSRLTEVKAVNGTTITYLDGTTGTVPASGRYNYVVVNGEAATENATCHHFVNGEVWNHANAGEESVNGETVLKEDKQHIYLPFNQLFTGYGWGVKHIPVYNGENYAFDGITILDRKEGTSVEKFVKNENIEQLPNGIKISVGDLFTASGSEVAIKPGSLMVSVEALDENGNVTAEFTRDDNNWENSTVTITGTGNARITIQDYYFCTPTSFDVTIVEASAYQMFGLVFENTAEYLYRVGNQNTVALESLFSAVLNRTVTTNKANVTVETVEGNAKGVYTANTADWTKGTIQFSDTGVVKVTIQDYNFCTPTVLYLEVVDAKNATTATSATANNVVLLNDCGFSSLEVSGGYTLYGNGFTMTCSSDSAALDMGYAFVTLNNGTLDNVQIVCPNFDYAVLYKSNMTESGNRSETTDKTRYFNVKSGVMASGNSQILNSRISGARAAVNVSGGNVVIDNSRIELGAVASILVGAANSLTLRDVTLVQKPTASTYDSSKTLMGFSVLFVCDENGNAAPVTLEGTLVQNAWVDENDKQYVPSAGQSIISTVLEKTEYLHDIDGDGTKELNLGFAYMPESLTSKVNTTTITDNRTNKNDVPYDYAEVTILNGKTYVYSYKNTNGTADSFKTESDYVSNKQGDIVTVTYSDTADGLEAGKSFGTNGWVYELNVDLDKASGYKLDFSKLSMTVNGTTVTDFKVNGSAKPTSPVAVTAGGVTYTLTATIDGKEYTTTYKVTGTETSKESPSLVAANYEAGLCVASSYGGTWHGAAPALQGIQIKYWSVAEKQYKTINLSDYTPTTKGQLNGTNTTWTYSPDNGDFTLTLTGGQVHSSNNVYAMPIVCDGKLYFVAAKSSGLVNTGNSARTIPVTYTFKDNNNGDVLTFSHTWSVEENKDEQYKYSDFCSGTKTKLEASNGGSSSCLAAGTMITLADGSKRAVEDLRKGDLVMSVDHLTGELTSNTVIIVVKTEQENYYKNTFVFDDGTNLVTINEHGIYDLDLNQYVNIDHLNYQCFIGHRYVSVDAEGNFGVKKLVRVETVQESGYKYDIVTDQTLNYVAEDTLSVTHVLVDVINSFDFGENLRYDTQKMQADIKAYGLYSYDEWDEYCDISVFEQYNIPVMKVGISKGMYTKEYIINLINTYVLDESVQIIN